jgi:hypothetical protein
MIVIGAWIEVITQALLLARHTGHGNAPDDFSLEDGVEQENRRRGDKSARVGESALNVATFCK